MIYNKKEITEKRVGAGRGWVWVRWCRRTRGWRLEGIWPVLREFHRVPSTEYSTTVTDDSMAWVSLEDFWGKFPNIRCPINLTPWKQMYLYLVKHTIFFFVLLNNYFNSHTNIQQDSMEISQMQRNSSSHLQT